MKMKILSTVGLLATLGASVALAQDAKIDRSTLPILPPEHKAITELDARDAKAPPRFDLKAPKDAPNVVIVIIDDIGFGSAGSFGGTIDTPTLDRLAKNGLSFNQFHTTAVCASTRMSLLTGRNHHTANMGDRDSIPR